MTNQLEKRIQTANLTYRKSKKAIISKVEVPILVTKEGLIPRMSTVDFTGIYKKNYYEEGLDGLSGRRRDLVATVGQGIAFDAKETENKKSFPLSNIKQHQLVFLEYFEEVGGTAFFLIHFKKLYKDKAFVTPLDLVKKYWYDDDTRRSIPITDFQAHWLTDIDDYLSYFITE